MAIYAYALIGLIVGILVRISLPASRSVGLIGSALLGALGGTVGALISSIFAPVGATNRMEPLSIVMAIIFAALVSIGIILFTRKRRFA